MPLSSNLPMLKAPSDYFKVELEDEEPQDSEIISFCINKFIEWLFRRHRGSWLLFTIACLSSSMYSCWSINFYILTTTRKDAIFSKSRNLLILRNTSIVRQKIYK